MEVDDKHLTLKQTKHHRSIVIVQGGAKNQL